jgi:hypothetical protein
VLPVTAIEANLWVKSITFLLSHVREKKKSMTTGLRTTPCLKNMIQKVASSETKRSKDAEAPSSAEKSPQSSFLLSTSSSSVGDHDTAAPSTPSKGLLFKRSPTRDEIRAYLGVEERRSPGQTSIESIESSPGVIENSPKKNIIEQILWSEACVVRYGDGVLLEKATMRDGDNGFKVAIWQDGEETQTEIPNITMKRPAAAATTKKPAKRTRRPSAKRPAAALGEEEEEESEDEEKGEEEDEEKEEEKVDDDPVVEPAAVDETMKNHEFQSKTWKRCKAEFYNQKAYITYLDNADGKWKLIVCVNKKKDSKSAVDHKKVLAGLICFVKMANMTKEKLVEKRESVWKSIASDAD